MSSPGPTSTCASWVYEAVGIELTGAQGLVDIALRRNPRRAQLLVSRVLGKHIPVEPATVYEHGWTLGLRVTELLDVDGDLSNRQEILVFGYAETATGLGHCVSDVLDVDYLHSTRRPRPDLPIAAEFTESHSHAPGHLVQPADPGVLEARVIVLVDDELSTGSTALNTIAALHALRSGRRYVIACLLDVRGPDDVLRLQDRAAQLGVRIDVVALATAIIELPSDVGARCAAVLARLPPGTAPTRDLLGALETVELTWPVPSGARHGFTTHHRRELAAALPSLGMALRAALWPALAPSGRVLVLGVEELMYVPMRLAGALADACVADPVEILNSSTTRSPVVAMDAAGYPIRTALSFPAHDGTGGERYAYNVGPAAGAAPFDAVVLVIDPPADTAALRAPGGLLEALRRVTPRLLVCRLEPHLLQRGAPFEASGRARHAAEDARTPAAKMPGKLPEPLRGPAFGSYAPDEVGWLLTDLSALDLEAPTAQREAAVQSGLAHYAESLPIEYQPGREYQDLFARSLARCAPRVAQAVGTLGEAIRCHRGPEVVLVSLARAGTPAGILLRRWLARRGPVPAHYAVSIIRGRGIDPVALRWLSARHDPKQVVFVDGWTGKGAIAAELSTALAQHAAAGGARFDPGLAVLADPGGVAPLAGTGADLLIPSACLNSTVSGLISRTVLRADLIGPGDFHGAKFHAHLAAHDVSGPFLDAITDRFDEVAAAVAAAGVGPLRPITWVGRGAVEAICAAEGGLDANFVKPGVGETTRVLLRRVPDKILLAPDADPADIAHVRCLAAERGVPVQVRAGLPYQCVGVIRSMPRGV